MTPSDQPSVTMGGAAGPAPGGIPSIVKALVYVGFAEKALEERPKPKFAAPTDAIVRIRKTTICGTDLHILKGDVPTCQPGRILGHDGIGIVDAIGPAVAAFKPGNAVLISCITACSKCAYCRKLMYSHCTTGGWPLGNTIDGTQAELVRVPMPIPASILFPRMPTRRHRSC